MKYLLINLVFGFMSILHASTGSITGQVIDADTHQPLIGANVIISGTELGAACNSEGRFSISSINAQKILRTYEIQLFTDPSRLL